MSIAKQETELLELSIFEVGGLTGAVFISDIQEINKHIDVTPVHNAPDYIRGMMNLRGNIITIIDLRAKFGMEILKEIDEDMRILVVNHEYEHIGLLVDRILDVVQADPAAIEPPPSNIQGVAGKYFSNIYKMENTLAAILNVKEILKVDQRR